MANAVVSKIEEHPVISSLIVGGAGLGIALIIAARKNKSSSSGSQIPYTATDAAGNPIDPLTGQAIPGASVSPGLSSSDLASALQDMEQQILNWEQGFNGSTSGGSTSGGSSSGGTSGGNSGGTTGGQTTRQKLLALLTGGFGNTFDATKTAAGSGSYYVTPTAESTQQLAQFFGLMHGWTDIAYNPHDAQFLQAAYQSHGQNIIPAGTKVWIPTTRIPTS